MYIVGIVMQVHVLFILIFCDAIIMVYIIIQQRADDPLSVHNLILTLDCLAKHRYTGKPKLLCSTYIMYMFIRCTMRCEIWAQPAELPR